MSTHKQVGAEVELFQFPSGSWGTRLWTYESDESEGVFFEETGEFPTVRAALQEAYSFIHRSGWVRV